MRPQTYTSAGTSNISIRDQLAASSTEVSGALAIFDREIKPPMLRPCEHLAYKGCARAFESALALLIQPNDLAKSVLSQMQALDAACQALYTDSNLVDDPDRDYRSLTPYPAWHALTKVASYQQDDAAGESAALGVNLGLAWVGQKKMAIAHMQKIRESLGITQLTSHDLTHLLQLDSHERSQYIKHIPWFKQFSLFLPDFRITFDAQPEPKPPVKTFDQKARDEFCYRTAFAEPRHRAGILDEQCLTRRQLSIAIGYAYPSPFASPAARRVAKWLVEFSGLNVQTIAGIPITQGRPQEWPEDWAIRYELTAGLLLRDLSNLARDSASPEGLDAQPSSYVLLLPAPQDVHMDIVTLASALKASEETITFGTLIPELMTLQPQWSIYPSADQFAPSWAKLSYSVGPVLVEEGMDTLLASAMVGNFGLMIKSKLFYSRLTPQEIWQAAAHAYRIMGHGAPVDMPSGLLAFGARVVPLAKDLIAIDKANHEVLEDLRKQLQRATDANRASILLKLHFAYSLAKGFRWMVRLSLRAAAAFPLRASVIESRQWTTPVREKGSARRRGGVAAIISSDMREELLLYRKHCQALYARFKNMGFKGVAMQWLEDVIDGKDVQLLAEILENGNIKTISTKQIVDAATPIARLAPDFGRKWMENALRTTGYQYKPDPELISPVLPPDGEHEEVHLMPPICTGVRTEDIDQAARHEAAGRETVTTVGDSCERYWAKRLAPVMDKVTKELFKQHIFGLRSK